MLVGSDPGPPSTDNRRIYDMYIDPGSTNVIVQVVIAGVAGAGLAIATFWRRIVSFFKRDKTDAPSGGAARAEGATAPPVTLPEATPASPPGGSPAPSTTDPQATTASDQE
jgi:hypothetical protein